MTIEPPKLNRRDVLATSTGLALGCRKQEEGDHSKGSGLGWVAGHAADLALTVGAVW